MDLVIDFDKIEDPTKREWLITSLKLIHIGFQTLEKRQTLETYNNEIEKGSAEIDRGEYTTATDLKIETTKW